MGKGLRNATGHRALQMRHHRESMRPRNLARSAEGWLARLDGSTLTTMKGAIGDLRRQNALHGHVGNESRNARVESSAVVVRCVRSPSLSLRKECRPAAAARYSLL
jgi:hypothetical protein